MLGFLFLYILINCECVTILWSWLYLPCTFAWLWLTAHTFTRVKIPFRRVWTVVLAGRWTNAGITVNVHMLSSQGEGVQFIVCLLAVHQRRGARQMTCIKLDTRAESSRFLDDKFGWQGREVHDERPKQASASIFTPSLFEPLFTFTWDIKEHNTG